MKITVQVKPKKKKAYVEKVDADYYLVSVLEPPVDGRANTAVIKALAKFFAVSPSRITLVSGHTAKMKTFEIPDDLKYFEVLPQQKDLFH
jgi:hypothetical protein